MTAKTENAKISAAMTARKQTPRQRITSGKPEPIKTRPARVPKTAEELKTRGTSRKVTPKAEPKPKVKRTYSDPVEQLKADRMLVKWAAIRADRKAARLPEGPEKVRAEKVAEQTWAAEKVAYGKYRKALDARNAAKVKVAKSPAVDPQGENADEAAHS